MPAKKLQIALEYMIIFAFVLVVFLFLFALIGSQRAQTSSSQLYSQEQLVAQSVAAQIDQALQAGNGYLASVPVTGTIGTLAYQLLVTKNGEVIVNATAGKQALQAFAFSTAKSVLSSSSYLQANTFYYNLPIANGTLSIQNSFGTICVDYQCPNTSVQAANVSLSSQVVHAATFGGDSYISIPYSSSLSFPATTSFSWGAWSVMAATPYRQAGIIGTIGGNPVNYALYFTNGNQATCEIYDGTNDYGAHSGALSPSKWYSIMCTYTGASSKVLSIYVNGVLEGSTNVGTIGTITSTSAIGIGTTEGTGPARALNSSVSNAQVYSVALSSGQAMQLYQAGIGGAPIAPANIVGWWPLNGNANDYSGNGNNGAVIGPVLYPAVAELFAKVTNQAGYALSNDLVGFTTTLGLFNGNQMPANQAYTNYTNSNGIATTFLTQQGNSGQAFVKATAYNGNTALTANLVNWWPLNIGQGNSTFDLSGNGKPGSLQGGVGWSQPNYIAKLDGTSAYVAPSNSVALQPTGQVTYSAWINPEYESTASSVASRCQRIFQNGADGGGGWEADFNCGTSPSTSVDCGVHTANGWSSDALSQPLTLNTWNQVTCQYSSTTGVVSTYVNGVLSASNTIGGTVTYGSTATPRIGADDVLTAGQFFKGSIANVQLYSTALSSAQISQLYSGGISGVPVTSSGVVGWWPLNGNANDYSGNGNNGTIYGNVSFVQAPTVSVAGGGNSTAMLSASFNGVSSTINVGSSNSLMPSSFTISGWAAFTANTAWMMIDRGPGDNPGVYYIYGDHVSTGSGNGPDCATYSSSSGRKDTFFGPLSLNTLYLLTCELNASSGTVKTFVNGVLMNTTTGASLGQNTYNVLIGNYAGGGYFTNGNFSNIQFYNTSLSQSQITTLYREGLPGLPVAGAGLVGWWPLNGNANDYSGNGNNGTATNVIYVQQRVAPPAQQTSFYGTGANFNEQSYINATDPAINWGAGVTASAWFNIRSSTTTWQRVVGKGTDANEVFSIYVNPNLANVGAEFDSGGGGNCYASPAIAIDTNRWYFATATSNSTTEDFYLNGRLACTKSGGTSTDNAAQVNIGYVKADSYMFNGSISSVQVYNTALTASQVMQLYNSQAPPSASTVVPLSWFP